jgi:hypothetical protein
MTGRVDVERILDAYLVPEADLLPDRVIEASLSEIARTPQRGALRVPWRFPLMNPTVRLATLAFAALIVGGSLLYLLGPRGVGPQASPSPTASTASGIATPAATIVDTTGWTPFVSDRLGISVKFPAGWRVVAATAPWIWQNVDPGPSDSATDRAVGPQNQAFVVASQKLPEGMTEDAWWTDYLSADTTGFPAGCFPPTRTGYESVEVAGHPGYLHGGASACNFTEVVVVVDGRAYQLTGYANVSLPSGGIFDRALLDAWLSTVTFDAAAADDTSVAASPSAS